MVEFCIDLSTSLYEDEEFETIITYHGKIVELDDNHEPMDEIGHFSIMHITEYNSLVMDGHSGELHALDVAVRSLDEFKEIEPLTAWYLSRLEVHPEYRRRGVGSNCVHRLLKHASRVSMTGVFVVCAAPLLDDGSPKWMDDRVDHQAMKQDMQALATLYSRLGLETLPFTHPIQALNLPNHDALWFYHNLEKRLPVAPRLRSG